MPPQSQNQSVLEPKEVTTIWTRSYRTDALYQVALEGEGTVWMSKRAKAGRLQMEKKSKKWMELKCRACGNREGVVSARWPWPRTGVVLPWCGVPLPWHGGSPSSLAADCPSCTHDVFTQPTTLVFTLISMFPFHRSLLQTSNFEQINAFVSMPGVLSEPFKISSHLQTVFQLKNEKSNCITYLKSRDFHYVYPRLPKGLPVRLSKEILPNFRRKEKGTQHFKSRVYLHILIFVE